MAKTVEELKKEAKEKLEKEKKASPQNETSKKLEEANSKIAFLEAKMRVLEEQSNKNLLSEEEKRLEQEAERIRQNEEALKQETDIARILNEALKEEPSQKEQSEELSQKDLVGIMADTVGKALDAQSKLTMGEMDKKLVESNKQIAAMQKVMIDFLSGMSVERARSQYKDFDKYSAAAQKIHASHPTLTPEQAYKLAKAEEESKQPSKDELETEKPTEPPQWNPGRPFSTSRGSAGSEETGAIEGNPRQRFRQELSSAIDDYLAHKSK